MHELAKRRRVVAGQAHDLHGAAAGRRAHAHAAAALEICLKNGRLAALLVAHEKRDSAERVVGAPILHDRVSASCPTFEHSKNSRSTLNAAAAVVGAAARGVSELRKGRLALRRPRAHSQLRVFQLDGEALDVGEQLDVRKVGEDLPTCVSHVAEWPRRRRCRSRRARAQSTRRARCDRARSPDSPTRAARPWRSPHARGRAGPSRARLHALARARVCAACRELAKLAAYVRRPPCALSAS